MFVTDKLFAPVIEKYGAPKIVAMTAPVSPKEYDFIRSTQKNGRNHDVTLYIFKDDKVIVNAKHYYPPGMFRALSGGVNPGETVENGIKREAYEETGSVVEIEKYLMRIDVDFTDSERHLEWHSHIFKCKYLSGELKPIDTEEIREVILADLADFDKFKIEMLKFERGGLHYRARLHDAVKGLL